MSFVKTFAALAVTGALLCSTSAFAGAAGGGTELPSSAEPNKNKDSTEKKTDSMKKDDMKKDDMKKSDMKKDDGGKM